MAKIGDLRVDMSIDSSGVQKGLKAAQDSIANVSSSISKSVNASTTSSIKALQAPISEISNTMRKQMGDINKQTANVVEQMNNTFKQVTLPKNLTDTDAFKMGTDWKVASQEILKFISDLTKAGLITQQTSSRLKAFSFVMLDTGYSVQQIRTGILQTIRAIGEMGTGARYSTSNIMAYAMAMDQAATSAQRLLTAGLSGSTMLGGGGSGGGNDGGGGGSSFNIDPSGDGRNSIILYRKEMTTLQTVGSTTASSLRSSFKALWKDFTSKGINSLKKFIAQCDEIAHKGNLISKIWASAGHIIQGIVISQTFYNGLNKIQDAASAVWDFTSAVEDAEMALSAMFRDTGKAERLTDVLQEFAANTAFSYEQANAGARKLLAYGIQAKNVLTVMEPLADAAAASGDSNTFDSIAKAIGQIYTKGKLATQEILQLTEAGIPAYEILQEELGLTNDELADIGRMGIHASTAINALLEGMKKRYSGVGEAMQTTMSGMLNKMKDNLLIIGGNMFTPMYEGLKSTVRKMSDTIEKWRKTVSEVGFAGLIQSLVSPEVFAQIQLLLANIKILQQNMIIWWHALSPVVAELAKLALTVGNMVLPILNALSRILASMTYYITNCTPAVRYFLATILGLLVVSKVTTMVAGLGAAIKNLWICKTVAKAVMLLVKAIRALSLVMLKSPWLAVLAVAAGGLAFLAASSDKVKNALTGVGNKIAKVFGVDPSKTFAPENDKNTASAEEFSEALEDTGESMDDLRDKANKANKAARNSLMSFDEVFTLPEELDDTTDDLDDALDMGNIEIPEWDVGDIDFGDMETNGIERIKQIAKNLVEQFGTTFRNLFTGAAIGAIIGAAIGGILGGPAGALIGAKIGAVVGGIVGLCWENFSQQWKNTFTAAGIGGLIGALVGLFTPLGPLLGGAIGAAIGGLIGWCMDDSKTVMENFNSWLKSTFKPDWDGAWDSLTGIWDTLSESASRIWEGIKLTFTGFLEWMKGIFTMDMESAWTGMSNTFNGLLDIADGVVDGVIGSLQGVLDFLDSIFGPGWGNTWYGITDVLYAFLDSAQGVWNGFIEMCRGFIQMLQGIGTGDWAMAWEGWKMIVQGFVDACGSILKGIEGILQGVLTFVDGIFSSMWGESWEECKRLFKDFGNGVGEIWQGFMDVCNSVLQFISGIFTGNWSGAWNGLKGIVEGAFRMINGILDTFEGACSGLAEWLNSTLTSKWGGAWNTMKELFRAPFELITGLWGSLRGIFQGVVDFISGSLAGNWSRAWQGLVTIFKSIMSGLGTVIKTPLNLIIDAVNWVISGLNKISFKTPDWVPGVGGKQFGVNISKIPRLAKGGLITKNTFAELGEGNKHEAVIPLENGTAIDQISSRIAQGLGPALAREMGSVLAQSTTTGTSDEAPIVAYIGNLIADDRGLKELERKLKVIRVKETKSGRG